MYLEDLLTEGFQLELRPVLTHEKDRTVDNFGVHHLHRFQIVLKRVSDQNSIATHDGFQERVEFIL
jgi:hypothetical protein